MPRAAIVIRADWDPEASVWVATSTDIDGLTTEAETFEALQSKVLTMVGELIELTDPAEKGTNLPVCFVAHRVEQLAIPA